MPKESRKELAYEIVMADIGVLNPAPYNPRRAMTEQEKDALRRSLKTFGFVQPLVVQKSSMVIIAGHQRLEVAKEEGTTKVPVFLADVSDDEAKVLNLALNKIGSDFEEGRLRDLLVELTAKPLDMAITGFSTEELLKYTEPVNTAGMEEMDLTPPPKMVWYLLGIPLNKFGLVQKHLASLEKEADISIQTTNANTEATKRA